MHPNNFEKIIEVPTDPERLEAWRKYCLGLSKVELTEALEEIARMSSEDPLTKISSRRSILHMAEKILAGAKKNKRSKKDNQLVAFGMIDIDYFKKVNDTFGHLVGDQVLKEVASALRSAIRPTDFIGRIGGEEFFFILPETGLEAAKVAAEHIRGKVEESVSLPDRSKVTVSIGITSTERVGYNLEDLMGDADKGLYAAKEAGRNRVCITSE